MQIFRRRRPPFQQQEPCHFQINDGEDGWAVVDVGNPRLTQTFPGIPVRPSDPIQGPPRGLARSLPSNIGVPYGSLHYPFLPARPLEELPDIPEASQEVPREIKEKYNTVEEEREIIRKSLQDFKVGLGVTAEADLPACFDIIRRTAGLGSQIEIVQGRMKIDDENWQDFPERYKGAIHHFNRMYKTCQEFLERTEATVQYVETRLDRLKTPSCSHPQRRAILNTHEKLKHIPSDIDKFAGEIRKLLHDVDVAMNVFSAESFKITGMVYN